MPLRSCSRRGTSNPNPAGDDHDGTDQVVAAIKQPGNFDFLYHAGVLRKHEAPPSLAPPSLAPPAGPSALLGPSAANAPPPQQQKEVAHLLQQVGASALPPLPQQPQQLAQLLQQVGTPHSAAVQT